MEIFKIAKSPVNETIVINLVKKDYEKQLDKEINKKMPLATVKGFKKGKAPRNLVEAQYGFEAKINVVSEIVKAELDKYLDSENPDMLGNPLYTETENFNWNEETLVFHYEIGLAPRFELSLEGLETTKYKIVADQAMIDAQVERIQKQFGKLEPADSVTANSEIELNLVNTDQNIDVVEPFELYKVKEQATRDLFLGKKVGDVVTVSSKDFFTDDVDAAEILNLELEKAQDQNIELTATIKVVNTISNAVLDQSLFDKVYGENQVNSVEEMRAKIAAETEIYFGMQADEKFASDIVAQVVAKNNFELPADFLIRWIQSQSKTELNDQEAIIEYHKTETGLRYQLIESKAIAMLTDRITFEDLKSHTTKKVRNQMVQYGYNATDDELEKIIAKTLSDKDEIRKLSNEVVKIKALDLIKSKATITEKEVTFEEYIKEIYAQ